MESETLQILQQDHVHQSELLDLIEMELSRFDCGSLSPNLETIALALEYCADYPGHYHHPVEDAVYSRLLERMPRLKDRLAALDKDHETLAAMTESLSYAISKVIEGEPPGPAREAGARFIRHYRQHMRIEEEKIFPAASQHLDAADWNAIEAEIALPRDPLFDPHVRKAYLALHRRLIRKRHESIC